MRVHDLPIAGLGRVSPYGVYDLAVNVGIGHDTAAFAVASIRRGWQEAGQAHYPQAQRLLIIPVAGTALWTLRNYHTTTRRSRALRQNITWYDIMQHDRPHMCRPALAIGANVAGDHVPPASRAFVCPSTLCGQISSRHIV